MLEALVDPSVAGQRERLCGSGSAGAGARKATQVSTFPVSALREMAIISCSTKPARLHYQMKNAGLNRRVAFMNDLRDRGLGANCLAVMTYQQGDAPYKTRDGLIAFLTEGSPKLRSLLSVVHTTCFLESRKIQVIDDITLNAKFYEDSLRAIWIHCEILHSCRCCVAAANQRAVHGF